MNPNSVGLIGFLFFSIVLVNCVKEHLKGAYFFDGFLKVWKIFDKDQSGYIEADELKVNNYLL